MRNASHWQSSIWGGQTVRGVFLFRIQPQLGYGSPNKFKTHVLETKGFTSGIITSSLS